MSDLMTREEVAEYLEAIEFLDDEETLLARTALSALDRAKEAEKLVHEAYGIMMTRGYSAAWIARVNRLSRSSHE